MQEWLVTVSLLDTSTTKWLHMITIRFTYVSHTSMRWLMPHHRHRQVLLVHLPTSATPTWDGWCHVITTIRYTYISHTNMRWLMSHHHRHQVHTSVTPTLQAADAGSGSHGLVWDTTTADCDPRKWVTTDFRPETHPDNCVWNQTSFESLNDAIIVTFVGGFGPIFRLLHAVLVLGVDFRSCLHCTGWCTIDVLIPPISTRQWVCVDDGWWV